jgi:hypothetical protein
MRSHFVIAVSLSALCFLVPLSAAHAQRLYPVQGPATSQTPPPSFTANLDLIHKPRKITLAQAGGETFVGTWTVVTASFANLKTPGTSASYPPQPNLAFAWDLVYGQGFFSANILGSKTVGQATATGSNGTVLQLEFQEEKLGLPVENVFGVAIDNKGNIYKVVL